MPHQAQGLRRLFSSRGTRVVSVLAGPTAADEGEFVQALANRLSREDGRPVWLVDAVAGRIADRLGCRPLLPWRADLPLSRQVIRAGACGLIYAPGVLAGDAALARAAGDSRACGFLLFDGGRFTTTGAPLDRFTPQTLVALLGKRDAEAGYALAKALAATPSPSRLLFLGETADRAAQAARHFLNQAAEGCQARAEVCQIDNRRPETSSNTLTIEPNLTWVVSRIMQNDQPKVAHGGCSNSAEEVYQR